MHQPNSCINLALYFIIYRIIYLQYLPAFPIYRYIFYKEKLHIVIKNNSNKKLLKREEKVNVTNRK